MRRTTLFLSLGLLLLTGCETPLIHNSNVQRWCGERPCGWAAEGEIRRVGSWHEHDYAVSFVSDGARLSQFNGEADSSDVDCFAFTMLAKIDPDVRMFLELDFLGDGSIDFSQRLPESDFEQLRFLITPPEWYRGVNFILRKDGPGRAVLAELSAQSSAECTAPPVRLLSRPDGIPCEQDEDCVNGRCDYGRCGACTADAGVADAGRAGADCSEGQVCGVAPVAFEYVDICVAPGQDQLGDRCSNDAECASGICCRGACSECCTDADCRGEKCGQPSDYPGQDEDADPLFWPWQCAPGSRARESGAPCASDVDCASLRCDSSNGLRGCELDCGSKHGWWCVPCTATRVYGGACR